MRSFFSLLSIEMGKFTEYRLPLKSLPVGVHEFEYHLGEQFFKNMEDEEIRQADVLVKLTVNHSNDVYELNFTFSGTVIVPCDRCLDDLELPIDTSYHIIVKYGEDYKDDSDEFIEIPESDNYLNVAYMIHDAVILAIPIKHVHPLGKCNRAMSNILKKHRAGQSEDDELAGELIEEMDYMDADSSEQSETPTDSRWDKLKNFNPED